jgi:hypothetical protein
MKFSQMRIINFIYAKSSLNNFWYSLDLIFLPEFKTILTFDILY